MNTSSQIPLVHIVDDDSAVRESLSMLIESVGLRAAAYASPTEFLSTYTHEDLACLVLDIRMPEMSGLSLHRILKDRQIDIPVIFITGHGDVPIAVAAMKEGAVDFVEKPIHQQTLLDTIQRAINLSRENYQSRQEKASVQSLLLKLTEREREIFDMLMEGTPNKVIASRLSLSTRTIEVHRSNVFDKLGARSLAEMVRKFSNPDAEIKERS